MGDNKQPIHLPDAAEPPGVAVRDETSSVSEKPKGLAALFEPVERSPRFLDGFVLPPAAQKYRLDRIRTIADLGDLIQQRRKLMKLNQTELAVMCGVGRRFISELEGGKSSLEFGKALHVCTAIGIDLFARPRS